MWVEKVGVVHVHSRYSDGSAGAGDLVEGARAAGLDFLVMADHDTLAAQREGWEGVKNGVAVLVAAEITPRRRAHLLACRVHDCTGYAALPQSDVLDAIVAQNGFAVAAHPQGKFRPLLGIRHEPWYDWRHPAVRGLEIWSYLHDWLDRVAWWRFPLAHQFYRHPERVVTGPEPAILRLWDDLGRVRRLAGLGGLDSHGKHVPLADIRLFPYADMFRLVRNHFFVSPTASEADAITALWDAMENGRGFVAHDVLLDARGTVSRVLMPDGGEMPMGAERPFASGMWIEIRLPMATEIRLIADGRCRLVAHSDALSVPVPGPGVYRFEVRLGGRPWLFTNPFYLRPR